MFVDTFGPSEGDPDWDAAFQLGASGSDFDEFLGFVESFGNRSSAGYW